MSDTEDEYEQMLVKALQLALEEDLEERSQNEDRDQHEKEHKQIDSRKKLVPKSRRPMPKRSDVERIEEQETSNSNENQAEKQSRHAKDPDETPNGGNASDGVETNEDASSKNHNDEKMTEGDENEDQSSSPSPTPLSTITPPSVPFALHSKRAPSSTPDNELNTRPIFITQFAVPSDHMRTRNPLWTAKTEMADTPGVVLPEQKGRKTKTTLCRVALQR